MSSGGFCRSQSENKRSQRENKRKRKDRQILGSCQKAEKTVEHASNSDFVVDALQTVPNDLEKRLEELKIRGRVETIQITASLRLESLKDEAIRCLSDFSEEPPVRTDEKNPYRVKIIDFKTHEK